MVHDEVEGKNAFDDAYGEKEDLFGHPYREFQDYFTSLPRGFVLDLGCGQGRDALFLASLGYKVTAVDSSRVAVEQMMKKSKDITGVVADVFTFHCEEQFDIVLFDMLLHTFDNNQQKELLKKYAKNLKKGGIICIVFPDDMTSDHFMSILESLDYTCSLKDKITIKDVPKIPGEKNDFTFEMITIQLSRK